MRNRKVSAESVDICNSVRTNSQLKVTKQLSFAIAVLLSILVCLVSANAAFAWLTDSREIIDDFIISDFEEPAYAALYGQDLLAFGRGEPAQEYDDRVLTAVYRGMESGEEDFSPDCVGSWNASAMNESSKAPWNEYKGRISRVVSMSDQRIRPINMQNWFGEGNGAHSLVNVDLSCIDTSKCTNMALMFNGCQSIESLDVSKWNMKNCLTIASMFNNCKALKELDVSSWSVDKLGNADGGGFHQSTYAAFSYCESLEVIDTSGWKIDFADIYTSLQLFTGCKSLKVLDVGGFGVVGNRGFGQGFKNYCELAGCVSLEKIVLSSSFPVRYNQYIGCPFPTPTAAGKDVDNAIYWYIDGSDVPMSAWDVYYHHNDLYERFLSGTIGRITVTYVASREYSNNDAWAALYGENVLVFGRGPESDIPHDYGNLPRYKVYREIESQNFVRPWPETVEEIHFTSPIYPKTCREWFKGLVGLSEWADAGNLCTSYVESMYGMFQDCAALKYIDISEWDTSCVTDATSMFQGCASLCDLNLGSLNFCSATMLRQMFSACRSLENVVLPYNIGQSQLDMFYGMFQMFYDCVSLKCVDLSNVVTPDWRNNTATQSMFSNCESLSEVIIPCTFKFSIGASSSDPRFNGFPYVLNDGTLKTMWMAQDASRYEYASATTVANGYFGSGELPKVWTRTVVNTEAYAAVYGNSGSGKILLFSREEVLPEYEGMPLVSVYKGIENYAPERPWAAYSQDITRVEFSFPNDLPVFSPRYMNRWFKDLGASYIDVGSIDTRQVIDMSALFSGSYYLQRIDGLENWDVSKVTNTASMFACENLSHADGIQTWDRFYTKDTSWMFWGTDLERLDISRWSCSPEKIDSMFYQCEHLEKVELPTYLLNEAKSASCAFWCCTSLRQIDLKLYGSGWTRHCIDLSNMFNRCESLETISGISDLDMSSVIDASGMFYCCGCLVADCSLWNISEPEVIDWSFNFGAPGVIAPVLIIAVENEINEEVYQEEVDDYIDYTEYEDLEETFTYLEETLTQAIYPSTKNKQINMTVRLVKSNSMPIVSLLV